MTEITKMTIEKALKNRINLINKTIRTIDMHEDEYTAEEKALLQIAVWKNKGAECEAALLEIKDL